MGANLALRIHHFIKETVVIIFSQHEIASFVLRTLSKSNLTTPIPDTSTIPARKAEIQPNPAVPSSRV